MTVCIVLHCPVHSFLAYSCADQESFVTGVPMFFGFVLIFWRADDVVIIKRGVRGPDHLWPPLVLCKQLYHYMYFSAGDLI